MFITTTIALIVCIFAVNINGLERCPGPSIDSQEEFKWKYDAAPIVTYGTVTDVKNNIATLKVSCTLKGQLPLSTVELTQLSDVMNLTDCHYLAVNKQYVVFLESMKTGSPDGKIIYRLANLEEIEINTNTVSTFLEEECADEDDFDIEMTLFYYNNNLKCGQFTATCNQATKTSILALNYPPLTKSTTFLGGYKKTLGVPTSDGSAGIVSGKSAGASDEQFRGTGTIATVSMPFIVFFTSLLVIFNI